MSGSADHEVKFWDFELITDKYGVVHMAFKPSDSKLYAKLSGMQVTVYYEDDTQEAMAA